MDANKYQKEALTVEKVPDEENCERLMSIAPQVIGLINDMQELGKAADKMKRFAFYKDNESIVPFDMSSVPTTGMMAESLVKLSRSIHAILGLVSEVGEICEAHTVPISFGEEVDKVNIGEECGDVSWYVGLLLDSNGLTLNKSLEANIDKLVNKRFAEGYSDESAIERDVDVERSSLEDNLS